METIGRVLKHTHTHPLINIHKHEKGFIITTPSIYTKELILVFQEETVCLPQSRLGDELLWQWMTRKGVWST